VNCRTLRLDLMTSKTASASLLFAVKVRSSTS